MQDLRGKVAVVTGGGSGIGRGLALTFASEGMNVAIADVEVTAAEGVAEEVRAKGVLAIAGKVDVSDRGELAAFAERVYAEVGSCDLLCNNAGVLTFKRAQETTDADWDWTLGVNLFGVRAGKAIQNVFTIAKLGALVALIGLGLMFGRSASSALFAPDFWTPMVGGQVLAS